MEAPRPATTMRQSATGIRRSCIRWAQRRIQTARSNRGLTLIELLIVLAALATLSTIAALLYVDVSERARVSRAVADIANISSEISTFETLNERLPNDLAEVGRAAFLDPWGRPYEYLNFALGGQPRRDGKLKPINLEFDLYSKGNDGEH